MCEDSMTNEERARLIVNLVATPLALDKGRTSVLVIEPLIKMLTAELNDAEQRGEKKQKDKDSK